MAHNILGPILGWTLLVTTNNITLVHLSAEINYQNPQKLPNYNLEVLGNKLRSY